MDKLTVLQYEKPVADAYAEATRMIVENIAKHIAKPTPENIDAAQWETKKLQELGMLNKENAAIIRKALKGVPQATVDAMNAASRSAYELLLQTVPDVMEGDTRPPEDINAQYIEYWTQTALDKFNLTNTTMLNSAQAAYITAINGVASTAVDTLSADQQKAAYGTLNAVTAGILSGGLTLEQAKKRAIEDMADEGIYGFVDKAGRHWTPEAYTSMVLRTTVHNVDIQSTKAMSQEFGVDVFQCSWHPNSRPSHYDFQGKFYSWNDEEGTFIDGLGEEHYYEPVSNTGYGEAAGLFGINCGHTAFPMDAGVSVPFDPNEIQPREESDNGYAEAQQQRALERSVRDAKTKAEVYKTAGDTKKAAEWRAKVRDRESQMRAFLKETGRTRSYGREQVYGGVQNSILPIRADGKGNGGEYTQGRTLDGKYYAADLQTLKQWVTGSGKSFDDKLLEGNPEAILRGAAGVFRMMDEFPAIRDAFSGFASYGFRSDEASKGIMLTGGGTVYFNKPYMFGDGALEKTASEMKEKSASGWFARNGSVESAGAHEAGHVLELAYALSKGMPDGETARMLNSRQNAVEIMARAVEKLEGRGYKGTLTELELGISRYATGRPRETIAESAADHVNNGNGAAELSKAILEVIAEQLP